MFYEKWSLPKSLNVNTSSWVHPTETKFDLSVKAAANSIPDIPKPPSP